MRLACQSVVSVMPTVCCLSAAPCCCRCLFLVCGTLLFGPILISFFFFFFAPLPSFPSSFFLLVHHYPLCLVGPYPPLSTLHNQRQSTRAAHTLTLLHHLRHPSHIDTLIEAKNGSIRAGGGCSSGRDSRCRPAQPLWQQSRARLVRQPRRLRLLVLPLLHRGPRPPRPCFGNPLIFSL